MTIYNNNTLYSKRSINSIYLITLLLFIINLNLINHTLSQNKKLEKIEIKKVKKPQEVKEQVCKCDDNNDFFENEINTNLKTSAPTYEIINNINYGLPKIYENLVFLQKDFPVEKTFTKINPCPSGYSTLSLEVFNELKSVLDSDKKEEVYDLLINPNGVRFKQEKTYILDDKIHDNDEINKQIENNGSNTNPIKKENQKNALLKSKGKYWSFKGLQFHQDTKEVKLINVNTFFPPVTSKNKLYTKCYLDTNKINIELKLKKEYDHEIFRNKKYQIFLKNSNIMQAVWRIGTERQIGLKPILSFNKEGCNYVYLTAKLLNNDIKHKCFAVYAIEKWSSDDKPTLANLQVISNKLKKKNSTKNIEINLKPSTVPFATNIKGLYMSSYTNSISKHIHLLILNKNLEEVKDIDINIKGVPLDVCRIKNNGFTILAKGDEKQNLLFVLMVDNNGKILWKKDIINNVTNPTKNSNKDLIFHEFKYRYEKDSNGNQIKIPGEFDREIVFGMNAMHNVITGKIAYANKRIGIHIIRMNNFNKTLGSGQADLMFTLDVKGENARLGFSWCASPSLNIRLLSDGLNFVTASLGSQHPKNIRVCHIETSFVIPSNISANEFRHIKKCKNFFLEEIPADAKGFSCGRLGGLTFHKSLYSMTYTRKPCAIKNKNGEVEVTSNNEFGLLLFDKKFNIKRRIKFGKGSKVTCINSVNFGDYLIITFTVTSKKIGIGPTPNFIDQKTDATYTFIVDFNGVVVSKPVRLPSANCNEYKPLKHGGISWASVNSNGDISLSKVLSGKNSLD